jgi:hypothetical protein
MTINYLDRIEIYRACAWILNPTDGSPKAPSGGALYAGEELTGVQDFTPTIPPPRTIPAVAQGTVQDTFILPSITARSAVLHTLYDLFAQNADLGNVKKYVDGDFNMVPADTDQEGLEPTVTLLVSGLVAHDDQGNSIWSSQLYPRAHIVPMFINKFDANVAQFTYNITWAKALKEFWGKALTLATMGTLKSGVRDLYTTSRPNFGVWQTDGTTKDFLFDTTRPPVNAATIVVYDYSTGAAISPAPSSTDVTGVHFTSAPTTGKYLIAPYLY